MKWGEGRGSGERIRGRGGENRRGWGERWFGELAEEGNMLG